MALNRKITDEKVEEVKKIESVKAEAATAVDAAVSEEKVDDGVLGSLSDKISLVAPLGDPSRVDTTNRKVDGKVETQFTSTIVGYMFKTAVDIDIPECGLGDDARKNPMSFKVIDGVRHVKAGETFALTRFETGVLLSQAQYNARISGEGKEFVVVYQKVANTPKDTDGTARITDGTLPTVSLRGQNMSIKDMKMIDVLTFKREETVGSDGKVRNRVTDRTIVKGFEKFEPLCRVMTRTPGVSSSAEDKNVRNASAQAFLSIVAKKRK